MSSVNPADYLRRFSSHLMLEAQDMRVRAFLTLERPGVSL